MDGIEGIELRHRREQIDRPLDVADLDVVQDDRVGEGTGQLGCGDAVAGSPRANVQELLEGFHLASSRKRP